MPPPARPRPVAADLDLGQVGSTRPARFLTRRKTDATEV
jgi:hypothetical protein